MGTLDIVIIAIFGVFFVLGFWKGFTKQLFSLVVLAGALAAAIFLSGPVTGLLMGTGIGEQINGWVSGGMSAIPVGGDILPAADIILTIIVGVALFIVVEIVAHVLKWIFWKKKPGQGKNIVNRLLGGVLNAGKAFLLVALLVAGMGVIGNAIPAVGEFMRGNKIAQWFIDMNFLEKIIAFVTKLSGNV